MKLWISALRRFPNPSEPLSGTACSEPLAVDGARSARDQPKGGSQSARNRSGTGPGPTVPGSPSLEGNRNGNHGHRLDHLTRLLAEFTYRPGWRFEVYEHAHEGPHLRIRCTVPNAYRPGEDVELRIESAIPPLDADGLTAWLVWRLERVEIHECHEWLRRNGELVSDPHSEEYAAT